MADMLRHRVWSAIAVLAGVAAVGVAGCTGESSPPGPATDSAVPTAPAPSATATGTANPTGTGTSTGTSGAADACALLTAADIAAVTGRQAGSPESRGAAGASICQYADIVVTRLRSPVTAGDFDATVRQIASAVQGQVKPVSGIGDAAAYIVLLRQICVVRQQTFYCIAGADQPQAEQLAERAAARL
jgi:hypothetical protein